MQPVGIWKSDYWVPQDSNGPWDMTEYADDLCLVIASTVQAKELFQRLKTILDKYVMGIAFDKIVWMSLVQIWKNYFSK